MRADRVTELDHAFRCPYKTLTIKQNIVLAASVGRANSIRRNPKPFENLSKDEIELEILEQKLYWNSKMKKNEMERILKIELQGTNRVPAMLFLNPVESLESLQLGEYELLYCEPMHDIAGHISNVFEEVPHHLHNDESKMFKETVDLCLNEKDNNRAFDHRLALLKVTHYLKDKIDSDAQALMENLVEIQQILYAGEQLRTPISILRLHNLTFVHAELLQSLIGKSVKSATVRKFYGKYYHNLTSHAAPQYRLISGAAANVEDEERFFNSIKSITSNTSSNKPEHIIANLFLRFQVEQKTKSSKLTEAQKQENAISKIYRDMKMPGNTFISFEYIKNNASLWQAHLERISDFLLPRQRCLVE